MAQRIFITATGTHVGKTHVTCALIHQMRQAGLPLRALKPVLSGLCEGVATSDAARILRACGITEPEAHLDEVAPFRFSAALSPDMAAKLEGRDLGLRSVLDFCLAEDAKLGADGTLLVEGVGGAFVPLNGRERVVDWIEALEARVVLVAGSYLGTLSHTMATVEALHARGVHVHALVLSESETSPVPLRACAASLRPWVSCPIFEMPRCEEKEAPNLLPLVHVA